MNGSFLNKMLRAAAWIAADAAFIALLYPITGLNPMPFQEFMIIHALGILLATVVMYTGLGAGVIWLPVLTGLGNSPTDAVTISLVTQIAGKGMGSFQYLRTKSVEMRAARRFIPYALIGVFIGWASGFGILLKYERVLLYIFELVVLYLLYKMLRSLNEPPPETGERPDPEKLRKSPLVVVLSSFFSGLLGIGNSDWLIPYMERHLKIPTDRAVATGILVMFASALFFLVLTLMAASMGIKPLPEHYHILWATCSGVVVGGKLGTLLVRIEWMRRYQKHVFIVLLGLTAIHTLW